MFEGKSLRQRLHSGAICLGTWVSFTDPCVTELLSGSGHDFLMIDSEHSAMDIESVQRNCMAALKADGGDLDLIDIEGNKVLVALRGKCSFCPSSEFTLKQYVETKLKEFVSDDIEVEEVRP